MDVEAERVVAPGDVLQPVLDPVVVRGVDHRLLAVVGPRVRAGRAELGVVGGGQREEPAPPRALPREGVAEVRARPRDDLDLRGDQLARDVLAEPGDRSRARVAQLLEAGREVERLGVEDRELLLEPDGEIGGHRERLHGAGEIDRRHR